jgi:hypothetical protein
MPGVNPLNTPNDFRNVQILSKRLTRTSELNFNLFPHHDTVPLNQPRKFSFIVDPPTPEHPIVNDSPYNITLSLYKVENLFPLAEGTSLSIRGNNFPPGTFPTQQSPKHYVLTERQSITFQTRGTYAVSTPLSYYIVPDHDNPCLTFTNSTTHLATIYTMTHVKSLNFSINPSSLQLE